MNSLLLSFIINQLIIHNILLYVTYLESIRRPALCATQTHTHNAIPGATELSAPCSRLSALSVSALAQRARQKFYSPPGYPGFFLRQNVRLFAPPVIAFPCRGLENPRKCIFGNVPPRLPKWTKHRLRDCKIRARPRDSNFLGTLRDFPPL